MSVEGVHIHAWGGGLTRHLTLTLTLTLTAQDTSDIRKKTLPALVGRVTWCLSRRLCSDWMMWLQFGHVTNFIYI